MGRMIDETGNRYGSLVVVRPEKDKNGRGAWLCKCDCGNEKIVRGPDLRTGKITSCGYGCPCKVNGALIDETGKQYGYLTVMYKEPFKTTSEKTLWHCKCSNCGKETSVMGEILRKGKISCGCLTKKLISDAKALDITGQVFGMLTAIEPTGEQKDGNRYWRCRCQYGAEKITTVHDLTSGNVQTCGKHSMSVGEFTILKLLEEKNINFKGQYTFPDLRGDMYLLRYDFAILSDNGDPIGLIEFNGKQHYVPVDKFGGEEGFKKRVIYDTMKINYAKDHNIPLLIIKYDVKNLQEVVLSFIKELK